VGKTDGNEIGREKKSDVRDAGDDSFVEAEGSWKRLEEMASTISHYSRRFYRLFLELAPVSWSP